ncbi:hypothetical protein N7522_001077 [Penicillium canescens]|uniref:Uncharacterized protein n=1 Tax=Penicillium canescens TaxID=5083 RepID=A0AAD6N6Z1_PENCN|nr:uncharacterized protein N7446_010334 [Penicillium canescens]KAJ6019010.1 hypothetical protein N7522_001077 [Penicillium canescens]KAJ6035573.1 hypothetical protein N7460_009748 [Penicillium canescens]KAJ6037695.1 hypothetical protein N7444_010400 [Penicillium canescens]KAJ6054322.1 hypothetical protein N7446_010334 [Penicillium canescens]
MAVLCSGASLMFWLLNSEVLGQEKRTKAIIYGQIIIGATIILGSIASIPLAVQIPLSENEIGVLLLLLVMNEVIATAKKKNYTDAHLVPICINFAITINSYNCRLVLHQHNDHLVFDFVSAAGSQ